MKKQTIKLNESQLRSIIKRSIKNVLNEISTRDMLHKAIPDLSNDKLESDLVGATSKYMNMDSYGKDGDISLLMGHNSDKLKDKKKQSDASWKAYDRAATLAKTNRDLFGNNFSDLDRNLNTDDDRAHARDYTTYNDMFLDMNESKLKKAIRESIKKVLKESETPIVIGDEDCGDLYSVALSNGDYSSVVFNVYCYSAQDALDEAVDYAENQGWNGLFDDEDEEAINEFPDDYITAGNHGHYLRIDSFVVRKV